VERLRLLPSSVSTTSSLESEWSVGGVWQSSGAAG
jgi:hypothetical protein